MNAFLDNDICEDELNYGDCMFDGLDCCGGDTALCTECLCKGMSKFKK